MSDEAIQESLRDRHLGDFRLLRLLGQGGMADVYLAEQISLKRQVALKVLRSDLVSDEVYLQRFQQEATAAAALNHPHIVQVYAIGEADGLHYIAQEYVHGLNLRDYLRRNGPPDAATAVRIMRQAADALQAAAEAGIVHRDVKPENLLINARGDVKIADFGLAQLSRSGERLQLTQIGMTMGTPLYMSPEQVNGENLDHRSDIYSLGVTCYHLLAGATPFRGESALTVAVKHINEEPPPLASRRADLPDALCDIVHTMMAKRREDRYQTAALLLDDLDRLEKSGQIDAAHGVDLPTRRSIDIKWQVQPFEPESPRRWWRRGLSFAGLCLLGAMTGAALGWWVRPPNPLDAPLSEEAQFPRQATARAQFFVAQSLMDDEGAWRAVVDYFPEAELESRRAREHLALLLLRERRFDEARELFEQLAAVGDDDPSSRATGLAGLAALASIQADYQKSQRIIALELMPLREELDRQTLQLVQEAVIRNRRHGGEVLEQDFQDLFRSDIADDAQPPSGD